MDTTTPAAPLAPADLDAATARAAHLAREQLVPGVGNVTPAEVEEGMRDARAAYLAGHRDRALRALALMLGGVTGPASPLVLAEARNLLAWVESLAD